MKLTYSQLEACAKGAVIKKENPDGSILLRRMTPDQQALYPVTDHHYHAGARAAGLALDFYTDAETLLVTKSGSCMTKRTMDTVDVLVDGKLHAHQCLWMERPETDSTERVYGPHRFLFLLPKGEKRVTVIPHYAMGVDSLTAELPDGSTFRPYTHKLRLLAFGDSITQGCTAAHPSRAYVFGLGRLLDAEVINHGIAGERFEAGKITGEYPEVDLVTIAYGTNDYGHAKAGMEVFQKNMPALLEKAAKTFPNTPIFVLLPLWRLGEEEPHSDIPNLQTVRDMIAQEAEKYGNMTVIDCQDFIPHDPKFFADAALHPNNLGMEQYAEALYEAIRDKI